MPEINGDTPTKKVTIADVTLEAPTPYTEGHVLNAGEASAFNQLFLENLRNNFAGQIKKARENLTAGAELDVAALQAALTAYAAEYEFGVRKAGPSTATPTDPVEREALNLAKTVVRQALVQQGYKLKEVGIETIDRLAAEMVKQPTIQEEARRRVESQKAVGAMALAGLQMPAPQGSAPAA